MFELNRWVERKGKRVEFGNVVGPHVGETYKYEFPTEEMARKFEKAVTPENGIVPAVDRDRWGRYKVISL